MKQLKGHIFGGLFFAAIKWRAKNVAQDIATQSSVSTDHHILECRHVGKQANVLEGAGNTLAHGFIRCVADQWGIIKNELAGIRDVKTG